MNGRHHIDLTRVAMHFAGLDGAAAEEFAAHAAEPDRLADIVVTMPGRGPVANFHGQQFSSLTHFVPGYRWDADKSLGVLDGVGDLAMWAAGCRVYGTSAPMIRAQVVQPKTTLDDFIFPSAAAMASHWSTSPWLAPENAWACHCVQDACIPHHAWGTLLWGHQSFEDDCEREWFTHRRELKLASDPAGCAAAFRKLVESVDIRAKTVEGIANSNAEWARSEFGQAHRLEECGPVEALQVCVRAIAATVASLKIMKGAA